MAREIECCMFLEFAKEDAYIMGLLAKVRKETAREILQECRKKKGK